MNYVLLTKLKEKPAMYEYLKENSEWIKYFNRHSNIYRDYERFIKEKYQLRATDKIANTIDNLDLVVNVLNTLK